MINKTLVYFENKLSFEEELEIGNISEKSIVFIRETGEIWTHGSYYTDYEKVKKVLFENGPGSISDAIKNLRNSILGSTVSEDYNTLSKIENFLKINKINAGAGLMPTENEKGEKSLSVSVDDESISINEDNELYLKAVDGGLY